MTEHWFETAAYVIPQDVAARRVDDEETVILDLRTEQYFVLNRTGSAIWHHLETGGALDVFVEQLHVDTGEDLAAIRADTADLLEELVGAGLLEKAAAGRLDD